MNYNPKRLHGKICKRIRPYLHTSKWGCDRPFNARHINGLLFSLDYIFIHRFMKNVVWNAGVLCTGCFHLRNAWYSWDTFSENYLESGTATVRLRHDVSHIYDHQDSSGLCSVSLMSFARSGSHRRAKTWIFRLSVRNVWKTLTTKCKLQFKLNWSIISKTIARN